MWWEHMRPEAEVPRYSRHLNFETCQKEYQPRVADKLVGKEVKET